MIRHLSSRSSIEALRKEAKRWLKALRAQDPTAHERFRRSHPGAPLQPGLRDVQYALAREHGEQSWAALKTALAQARRPAFGWTAMRQRSSRTRTRSVY
jgi:uncharacterized protein